MTYEELDVELSSRLNHWYKETNKGKQPGRVSEAYEGLLNCLIDQYKNAIGFYRSHAGISIPFAALPISNYIRLSDNAIKDMLAEEDTKFLAAVFG